MTLRPSVTVSLHPPAGTTPPRVVVDGELDLSTAPTFGEQLSRIVGTHPRVVLDISAVTFLDSSGLQALFRHRDHLQAVLVAEGSAPARALSLSGLEMVIAVDITRVPRPASR